MPIIETKQLVKTFGGLTAVSGFEIYLNAGELIGLIGPNGAGKTTAFNMLTGVYQPSSGDIRFLDESVVGKKPYEITQKGIARTFQNIRLFKDLSVIDNVKIAYHQNVKYSVAAGILGSKRFKQEEQEIAKKALELLKIFKLDHKAGEYAKNLPYGEQRRLEIARALATQPKLILLDEPAAGMNPQETQELMELIRFIRGAFDLTILLIEHDMSLVMNVCERIYVLDYGKIIAHGTPQEIKTNPKVIEAYLGEEVAI
ncbi:branched-chain amino acid transport system ATP-binding protein [Anaerosolibacter carboniphilus]|uniref:Branched-chain amino acid transport system ATP-binding protein n=1 Tax=Anaerosolibacter carboniphilus TaxID=1417629 RepID=A0A841L144_9FIRM|nr:ABC transporter ATP-binding protein [Anaerosolibacter carboniphilus]MBB6218318.1 branched-chain amino acid transport system ATP-binding protein [Anaerosolibacter carboniphilus]